jgi:hypothetical protein
MRKKRIEKEEKKFKIVCCHFLQFQVRVCDRERERGRGKREKWRWEKGREGERCVCECDREKGREKDIEKFFFVEKLKSFF